MIDRYLNHTCHPTLPTTVTERLLPPSVNENNGHQFVASHHLSHSNIGNPHHVGLSDNITLPDGEHRASTSLPSLKCIGTRASLSRRDSRTTKTWSYNEQSTRTASRHSDSNTSDSRLSYQYFLPSKSPVETSTPISVIPQGPTNRTTGLMTSHSHAGPVSSSKPVPSSTYKLRGDADGFTPKSSPTTLYREIRIPPPESQNRACLSSASVFQIAEALAKVTQLQRLPQAKPDIFISL